MHAHRGDYADALSNKNNAVIALIAEIFGGLGRMLTRTLKFLVRIASDSARGRDSTDYGRARRSPGHFAFHSRRISTKAVFGDAAHISAGIGDVKAKASACIAAAAAACVGA